MITNYHKYQEFENELFAKKEYRLTYLEALKIYKDLKAEAEYLGVWHPENYLENIQKDIEIARVLNYKND